MREPLATILAFKRLLPCVDPLVLLQMVLELESLATVLAFEFSQLGAVSMVGHVSLQFVECRKLFAAHTARLQK